MRIVHGCVDGNLLFIISVRFVFFQVNQLLYLQQNCHLKYLVILIVKKKNNEQKHFEIY